MNATGTIHVSFERKVGDGEYGTETASCAVSADWGDDALTDGYLHDLAVQLREMCRDNVQAQLHASPERASQQAAETREGRAQRIKLDLADDAFRGATHGVSGARRNVEYWSRLLDELRGRRRETEDDPGINRRIVDAEGKVADALTALSTATHRLAATRRALAEAGGDPDAVAAALAEAEESAPF